MAQARFVLRFRGSGAKPADDVARIRGLPGAAVVDETSRMLLVEAPEGPLRSLVDSLDQWVMEPERHYAVPDTRELLEPPPD